MAGQGVDVHHAAGAARPDIVGSPVGDSDLAVDRETELERVTGWRLLQLLEAGYGQDEAERLAASGVDLHRAVGLVNAGCDPVVATRILL